MEIKKRTRLKIKHLGIWSISVEALLTWLKKQIQGDENSGRKVTDLFCYGELTIPFKLVRSSQWDYYLEKMSIGEVIKEYIKLAEAIKDNAKAAEMKQYYERMIGERTKKN